jgi:iron only hydrogenase large subunit-like protein
MSMEVWEHSVTLEKDKCRGCTNCIKRCPTEAIRVRDGKARIITERCVDCGECIRMCPHHAKVAVTDPLSSISRFPYKIALPAPSLYGQFKGLKDIRRVLAGLRAMGFDEVFEVARGADIASEAIAMKLKKSKIRPLISSACPAVVRLIQVRFPELLGNVVDVLSPMELAARVARKEFAEAHNLAMEQIGVFFITPCPAKMTSIHHPIGLKKSNVDGAISILEIYGLLSGQLRHHEQAYRDDVANYLGVAWANSGGESRAVGSENALSVDGIHNVIRVLEEVENGKLSDLEFFEGLACSGGCVGGALTFENAYVAKNRIDKLVESMDHIPRNGNAVLGRLKGYSPEFRMPLQGRSVMQLDDDVKVAMRMVADSEKIAADLPGLDCGSCGAPSCRALAEDIVRGVASTMDCVFILREKVKQLAEEMYELSSKIPTGHREEEET